MTAITKKRGFWQTRSLYLDGGGGYRSIVVAVNPEHLSIRLKGRRASYDIPWGKLYLLGAKMEAAGKLMEKARKAKEKKALRRKAR
jgi:hypothetical protein